MFRRITAAAVTIWLLCAGIAPQTGEKPASKDEVFDQIVSENTYSFEIKDGKIEGPAAGFLGEATERSQFVAFGEAHNKRAVHRFGGALFELLNRKHGFEHLAIEEDPAWAEMLIPRARKSDSELFDLVLKFPNAFHLLTEEEILMIGRISRMSKAKEPVWGLNQVFSALHIYSRLAEIAPDETSRRVANRLFNEASEYESERFKQNKHYLVEIAKASDFSELRKTFKPRPGTEAEFLISQIELSFNIFAPYGTTPSPPSAVFYESGKKRETNMKRLFADRYREARAESGKDPKVLAMFGHLHLYRGLSERTEQYTLGNLLSELALFNGG
ncbi:MAG: hypothetical protein J5I65_16975, partial [Aridibacter famidurans]|nr:hypothetical protein [Aridibacter famidurans]